MFHGLDFTVFHTFTYHFTVIAPVTKIQSFVFYSRSTVMSTHTLVNTQCSLAFELLSILAEESPE